MSKEQNLQALSGAATLAQQQLDAGRSVAQIQTPVVTAVRVAVPRDRKQTLARIQEEVVADPKECLYSWSVKNKDGSRSIIEGPTIKLANTLVREYGNCTAYPQMIDETPTHWIFVGTFVDFETGYSTQREFRQRKPREGKGKFNLDRTIDIEFQIGQSKAMRNIVVNAIPASILKAAIKTAKDGEKAEIDQDKANIATKRIEVVKYFSKLGVEKEQLEKRAQKPVDQWDAEQILDFRHLIMAIRGGETAIDVEFPKEDQVDTDTPIDVDDLVGE